MESVTRFREWRDLDWFALDGNNQIAQFASAGGVVPIQIASTNVDLLVDYFNSLKELEGNQLIVNPNLNNLMKFESQKEREMYLRDFIYFAKRGLYAFDKTDISNIDDANYHLVAAPTKY